MILSSFYPVDYSLMTPSRIYLRRFRQEPGCRFGIRFGMDCVSHRPAILRMRARDCSTGMP